MECDPPVLGAGSLTAEKLEKANINPATGLATDYLNHFNEVVMLLEMLPAMPECAEDVLAWKPLDYCSHFENSSFTEKQLAITAYEAAPPYLRENLETLIREINAAVQTAQDALRDGPAAVEVANDVSITATATIKPLISVASGVIHGHVDDVEIHEGDAAQAEIDALFA
ncbi:hypothetical protein GCM10011316_24620 [Roseibium aquae]|uniref:Uncharacterized protein n=1 Tax=Roseibium aquae TaxID=1323746 RepID=A0A916TKC6_9HYPH|nr:hypothetical protein [Roseibium aquae]GGB51695.1 hypothetical protein GCM10011316_24620 [Roseibium aquae]